MNALSVTRPHARNAASAPLAAGLPWLVADVGGTNARFGWVSEATGSILHVRQREVSQSPSLAAAARSYLEELSQEGLEAHPRPGRAALAVATAIQGDRVAMTNSPWSFSRSELQRDLGLQELQLLNDFEALALSLPKLSASQLRAIAGPHSGDTLPHPSGTLAVIGPGTGLGVAGVVQTASGWQALPGEGGHATLAPTDDFESEVLAQVRRHFDHVSAERLLSGIGLPVLHAAVAHIMGSPQAPGDTLGTSMSAPDIVQSAHDGDPVSERTVQTFCALLGSFAGNVALTLGARQGVYIGGGIVPRLGSLFARSNFREKFEAKGRFRAYLEQVPTVLITDTLAALTGAAFALEQSSPSPRR